MSAVVRFDDAWRRVAERARAFAAEHRMPVTIVRDLEGILRVVIDDRERALASSAALKLGAALRREGGAFVPEHPDDAVLCASGMYKPTALLDDAVILDPGPPEIRRLERLVVPSEWQHVADESDVTRLAFYGIKGGVGRSTALTALAAHLARQPDAQVLVVDLDLESPGVWITLLPDDRRPDFGIVDWFVEQPVGQADDDLLASMIGEAERPPGPGRQGHIFVAPCAGRLREGYDYFGKLGRVYQPLRGEAGPSSFADRVVQLVSALERQVRPTITLIDSRAGLHEIAAASLVALGATGLLFAGGGPQTWADYHLLFSHFRDYRAVRFDVRERIHIVAALVPEAGRDEYLRRFRERSYDLFSQCLYDLEGLESRPFTFNAEDPLAPHQPLPIHWSRLFLEYDPAAPSDGVSDADMGAAFGKFWDGLEKRGLLG